MISKVLVANRGEIAIRAFRAAYELGVGTVAVYPYEDRNSLHRLKADESYQIGEIGHPVRAYLSVDEIVDTASRSGADDVRTGRPASRAAATARDLFPVSSRTSALGPTKVISAFAQAAANSGFSDKKPYPGYTASAPALRAVSTISSTDR